MSTTQHLFAYGTLMAAATAAEAAVSLGAGERARLARQGRLVCGATMAGRLFDLGRYPGLVEAEEGRPGEPQAWVTGELWRLDDPEVTLRWLDDYEGIDPARPDAGEYRRVIRPARVLTAAVSPGSGEGAIVVPAWVYLYAGDVSIARLIASGSWLAR